MENKFYTLIFRMNGARWLPAVFFLCFAGWLPARAQDTSACTAQFYVSYNGNQVYFRAADSITGVQHEWFFGDSTSSGWGNYVGITHTYAHTGAFYVVQKIFNPATGCRDSSAQVINIASPSSNCSIIFYDGHDSTRKHSPYRFYATPYLGGATSDTVSWLINGSPAGTGDTMSRTFTPGTYAICALLHTSAGCSSQYCQTIYVGDSAGGTPPDSIHHVIPPDSAFNPGGPCIGCTPPDSLAGFLPSYPNPAASQTYVNVHLDNPTMIYVRVYNSMGSQVEQQSVSGYTGNNHLSIPVGGLQSGIYLIQLQYGNTIKRSRMQKL